MGPHGPPPACFELVRKQLVQHCRIASQAVGLRLQHLRFGRVWVALAKTFTFLAGATLYLVWLEPYLRSFGGWWLTDVAEVHGGIHNTALSCVEAIGRGAAMVVGGAAILLYNIVILALHLWLAAPVRSAVTLLVATVLAHW